MSGTLPEPAPLPFTRRPGCPFDPPEELAPLREQHPISRMAYSDGHVGWLVTGHALAREVLADPRFSTRRELIHFPFPGGADIVMTPAPVGHFTAMDPPEHTRYRRLLTGQFTVRRMDRLTARIKQITAEHLDAMEKQGSPVDLVNAFAYPIPALTICELLGVPSVDHDLFQREAKLMNSLDATESEVMAAVTALDDYMRDLIASKRAKPTDDLLSDLTTTDLTDDELAGIGTVLLGSGLDSTANMIALGVFAMLSHPDQFSALRAHPGIADNAVEELLRYLSVIHTGAKAALEDVELGGHLIRAGDTVTVSLHAANRDPERFADPDTLDLRRRAIGHLAFGHGIHQCLGQQLARVEMRVAYPALLTRFPTLRLAVRPEEVPLYIGSIYGVQRLPVAWDKA
ncbi:cytochrome P450 [Streptomyces sp. P9-2B-2]|uniref:cytochrome P450 n=1 Tax=Streptomyces sp. P9-2B-2 TaxID=3057114 RepID=UPI0025B584CC|nr:cytochrome P450 [Streptomyces sp. P9-2B-2]WJY37084.1 cytochrome P450 [Streptomyces sp. P9-2B-2]